jgi:hypothetical protein
MYEKQRPINQKLSNFLRLEEPEESKKVSDKKISKLKKAEKSFVDSILEEYTVIDAIPPPPKMNEYIEFMFNLTLELIALVDFTGDLVLLAALFKSEHSAWFSVSCLSMLSPFFICYVPLLTF